jgi:hypothetical protein
MDTNFLQISKLVSKSDICLLPHENYIFFNIIYASHIFFNNLNDMCHFLYEFPTNRKFPSLKKSMCKTYVIQKRLILNT